MHSVNIFYWEHVTIQQKILLHMTKQPGVINNGLIVYKQICRSIPSIFKWENTNWALREKGPTPLLGHFSIYKLWLISSYLKRSNVIFKHLPLRYVGIVSLGIVHILRNHFVEVTDRILWPESATVGCGHRPQHLWGHSNP